MIEIKCFFGYILISRYHLYFYWTFKAINLFCQRKNIPVPTREQRRRWIKLCPLKSKRATLNLEVKYKNAQNWKEEYDSHYGATNNEIIQNALNNNFEIFNGMIKINFYWENIKIKIKFCNLLLGDETQLLFDRANENTKVLVPDGVEGSVENA